MPDDNPSPFAPRCSANARKCGEGKLFDGFLELAKGCDVCGLDYGFADSGDGPAVFVTLLAGFVVLGLALWVEIDLRAAFLGSSRHFPAFDRHRLPRHAQAIEKRDGRGAIPSQGRGRPAGKVSFLRRNALLLLSALIGVGLLSGLGVWQLQRLAWKEDMLAQIAARRDAPPQLLPPQKEWSSLKPDDYDYRHVTVRGTFDHARESYLFRASATGAEGGGPAMKS